MATGTTLLVHDLTSDALYCDHFRVEAYSDVGLTTLVASGISKTKWDGAVQQQLTGIYLEGLSAGTTYYLRWGPVAPQTGLVSWGDTETVALASASVPSATFTPAYFPVSSGVTYTVTPSSVSSDVDHYEAYFNLTGTTPAASQVASFKCLGPSITDDFHFFVGGTPGDVVSTWVRAVDTGTGASTWHALANQTVVNFVGNLDNISDGTTYAKTKASELTAGKIAKIQGTAVSATGPTTGQVLKIVSATWTPSTLALNDLSTDVLVSSPADTQVLTYEASSSTWKNKAAPSGGGGTAFQSRQKENIIYSYYSGDPLGFGNYAGPRGSGDTIYVSGASNPGVSGLPGTAFGAGSSLVSSGTSASGFMYGDLQYRVGRNLKLLGKIWLVRITDTRFKFGMFGNQLNDTDTGTDDMAWFRFSTIAGDTHYKCITGDATTTTITDSGISPVANTERSFAIIFDDVTPAVKFYIDGTLVATNTTHLPRTAHDLGYSLSTRGNSTVNTVSFGQIIIASDY